MNSSKITLAILATSLLIVQPVIAIESPPASTSEATSDTQENVSLLKRKWRAFTKAYRCARDKGISSCSRGEKAQLVVTALAILAALMLGTRYITKKQTALQLQSSFTRILDTIEPIPDEYAYMKDHLSKFGDILRTRIVPPPLKTLLKLGVNPDFTIRISSTEWIPYIQYFIGNQSGAELYVIAPVINLLMEHGAKMEPDFAQKLQKQVKTIQKQVPKDKALQELQQRLRSMQ